MTAATLAASPAAAKAACNAGASRAFVRAGAAGSSVLASKTLERTAPRGVELRHFASEVAQGDLAVLIDEVADAFLSATFAVLVARQHRRVVVGLADALTPKHALAIEPVDDGHERRIRAAAATRRVDGVHDLSHGGALRGPQGIHDLGLQVVQLRGDEGLASHAYDTS